MGEAQRVSLRGDGEPPPVTLSLIEIGWLTFGGGVWQRAKGGDPVARSLYLKLKAAAIAAGVVWYYGDPWPEAAAEKS